MKSEKGITLVALVITIVVLLILAAVAIFMVMDGALKDSDNTAQDNTTITSSEPENKTEEVEEKETQEPTHDVEAASSTTEE